MKRRPSRTGTLLLRFVLGRNSGYGFLGDIEEMYNIVLNQKGILKSKIWFWKQIFVLLPAIIIENMLWSIIMFKSYLKIAFRNLRKYKGYSFINIVGLAIGIASCMLIYLYIADELSYDRYHKDGDRIYRVALNMEKDNSLNQYAFNVPPLAPALKKDFPQVENSARIMLFGQTRLIKYEDKLFYESGFVFADSDIFTIFTIPFLNGDPENALARPNTVVLTKTLAEKYFGTENPLGKVLNINDVNTEVTGVIADQENNTHMPYSLIASVEAFKGLSWMNDWTWPGLYTYIKLSPETDYKLFEGTIKNLPDKHIQKKDSAGGSGYSLFLQPVKDIHLFSNLLYEAALSGNINYIYILFAIGILILIVACINFMNLATARSANRAREVGLRKVVGANRPQLIRQFIGESIFLAFFSLGAGYLIAVPAMPWFNQIAAKSLSASALFSTEIVFFLVGLTLFTGFIAGCYPAFYLSGFKPVKTLKGKQSSGTKGSFLRKALVSVQFAVSILLIIGALTVNRQIDFMVNRDMGFEKNRKLIVPQTGRIPLAGNYASVKSEFLKHSSITGASAAGSIPGGGAGSGITRLADNPADEGKMMYYHFYDYDFIREFNINIIAGRNFSDKITSDTMNTCLLNETAAAALGFRSPAEAVGKFIIDGMDRRRVKIIGVTEDFHYRGLQEKIEPLVMLFIPRFFSIVCLTVNPDNINETLKFAEAKWKELFPSVPFSYYFLDSFWDRMYSAEQQTRSIFEIFTFLGLFIACMGLFGLVSFTAESRSKEIGIRKTLGASSPGIVMLLSKEFTKWVIAANVIAWPAAYYFMNSWLHNFPYRTGIDIKIFIVSGLFTFLAALITVSYKAVKAASANPVNSLKCE